MKDASRVYSQAIDNVDGILGDHDRLRFGKINGKLRRKQFLAARFLLQNAVFEGTRVSYRTTTNRHGRPKLKGTDYACSISHSDNTVAVGICTPGTIGIDLECWRSRHFCEIVEQFFCSKEQLEYKALDDSLKASWFYRQWTRKEAMAKAMGRSITEMLAAVESDCGPMGTLYFYQGSGLSLSCVCDHQVRVKLFATTLKAESDRLSITSLDWSDIVTPLIA